MARVLVIDDSPTVVRSVRAALAADGHAVDGLEFFVSLPALLRERPPDLILLDLEMPGISGVKLWKFMSDARARIPVIIYSSLPEPELRRAAVEIGAIALLGKCAPLDELRRTVSRCLR